MHALNTAPPIKSTHVPIIIPNYGYACTNHPPLHPPSPHSNQATRTLTTNQAWAQVHRWPSSINGKRASIIVFIKEYVSTDNLLFTSALTIYLSRQHWQSTFHASTDNLPFTSALTIYLSRQHWQSTFHVSTDFLLFILITATEMTGRKCKRAQRGYESL